MAEKYSLIIENLVKIFNLGYKRKNFLSKILSFSGKEAKKKFRVLDNISFKVKRGEIIGILGKNGSGKSTLLRTIAGIYKKDSGKIIASGKIITLMEVDIFLKERLTVKENIYLIGKLFKIPKKEMINKEKEILDFSELNYYKDTKVYQISIGMQERLAFAIAVNSNPKLLIIDELFSHVDIEFQNRALNKLQSLAKSGVTIIIASQRIKIIKNFCNKVIEINQGKLV